MNKLAVYTAPVLYRELDGLVKLFKPAEKKLSHCKSAFLFNVCKDLNSMKGRPQRQIFLEPGGDQNVVLRKINDLSDDVLAVGPRYVIKEIECSAVNLLGERTSGVLVLGLNRGAKIARSLRYQRFLRTYHVRGLLGESKENYFWDSRITCKSRFSHVTEGRFSSVVASLQASHQRRMYEMCGVDLQSQAAYELALKGVIRPENNHEPLVYGISLVEFKPPNFTLEIHVINEDEQFLGMLVNDIAIELKTVAHCCGISCIRYGPFNLENTLLRRHWSLKGALLSINDCKNVIENEIKSN